MEVILSILAALFGIGFGIFMALHPEDAIALSSRSRRTPLPCVPAGGTRRYLSPRKSTSG